VSGPGPQRPGAPTVADVASRASVLRRLELEVLRRLDGSASGDHQTTAFGPGSERAGARGYQPGDDARLIDWNLTARSAETFVRTTEAEREVDTWIVADRSASLDFGTSRAEKRDVVLGASAAFGMLTVRGHNRLGVVLSGGDRLEVSPARSGRAWLMAALATMYDTPRRAVGPSADADLAAAMRRLAIGQARRSQVVVLSDFLGSDDWALPLQSLARRHQVLAVHITDPRELELPAVGILGVVDAETGRQRYVQTSSKVLRTRYAQAADARTRDIARRIHAARTEYLHLSTTDNWLTKTIAYATQHSRLRASRPADRGSLSAQHFAPVGVSR
jgi:uncharacterized protein (DUF58 family)